MVPAEVEIVNRGLGLLRDSYHDLSGKTDAIVERAVEVVRENPVQGLMITGGFVGLFNPGLEEKVAETIGIPVTAAVSSVTAAMRALDVKKLILVTPFEADMNAIIVNHLEGLGFTVFSGPTFARERKPGAEVHVSADELIGKVTECAGKCPGAKAIYFQGATLDPLPVIQELEGAVKIPVVTSNTAMIWNILSKLGLRFSIKGYGRLLSSWPSAVVSP